MTRIVAIVENEGEFTRDLMHAGQSKEVEIIAARWQDLGVSLFEGRETIRCQQTVLNNADVVLLRTLRRSSFEQVFFRMDVIQRLEAMGIIVVNPARAIEIAVDKYLSLSILQDNGLPIPDTFTCQTYEDAMVSFDKLGGDVVVKPMFGAQGFGMARITDRALAQRAFSQLEQMGSISYIQRFISHPGADLRLFVLGDMVLAAMRRHSREGEWRCNISQGGYAKAINPDPTISDMAIQAARSCQAVIAGVDIIIDHDDQPYILEVNPIPGWKALGMATGIDITGQLVAFLIHLAEERHVHI